MPRGWFGPRSEEAKEKLRQAALKRGPVPDWVKEILRQAALKRWSDFPVSSELREKRRLNATGRVFSEESKIKRSVALTGRSKSSSEIEKHRQALMGRKRTEEFKAKIRNTWKSLELRKKVGQKVKESWTPERREEQRQRMLLMKIKSPWTPEKSEKQRQRMLLMKIKKPTGIELMLREAFENLSLSFEMYKPVLRFKPDFVFLETKLIVEADGEYWHGSEEAKLKDTNKDKELNAAGWKVLRFNEKEIKNSPQVCADKVYQLISGKLE